MIFINEGCVNETLDLFEDDKVYLDAFKEMLTEAPDLTAYLNPQNYTLLTSEELSLLEYLACVIYHSCKRALGKDPVTSMKSLENHEETNWEIFNDAGKKNFSKVLDLCFESYPQEDLLALVEDAIISDDDTPVTIVGSEIIFVSGKTIIDAMHADNI